MFNPRSLVISCFIDRLEQNFRLVFGDGDDGPISILRWTGFFTLEKISQSDCLYHDVEHAIICASVGQDILLGKRMQGEEVTPSDWVHFVTALLCSHLGYLRGLCAQDGAGRFCTGMDVETIELPPGATGAALAPYAIDRAKLAVRAKFSKHHFLDVERLCEMIECSRFPITESRTQQWTQTLPGLIRAAQLIGIVGDPFYMRKLNCLFLEFQETGQNEKLGFSTTLEFREGFADFYAHELGPYIQDGLGYLRETQNGRQWIANIHSHLHAERHQEAALGVSRKVSI